MTVCPLCDKDVKGSLPVPNKPDMDGFDCARCGKYQLSGTLVKLLKSSPLKDDRYIISGLTRRASENGRPLAIVSDSVPELLKMAPVPRTLPRAIDEFLLMLGR